MKTWLKEKVPFPVKMALKRQIAAAARLWNRRITWGDKPPTLSPNGTLDLTQVREFAASLKAPQSQARIRTSIIIPVFNKADFTFQCLRSLFGEIDLDETEVIIINNASTDATSELLSNFAQYVQVISNTDNKGFVDACNQGASKARGEFLIFLNNDTIVLPGWLSSLVDTLEQTNEIGAVGSLFLYPSGRIQEAGAFVWKDGAAFHYGWGKSPEDHRFVFARDVDYCSGASLLIRKGLFEQLNGFDRRFAPAYYEDVDLCFGVRSLGYRMLFQPASRLIHYEGATAGRKTPSGFKQYQVLNQQKFYEKWKDVLEHDHFVFDKKIVERAAHRVPPKALIVFDDRIPTPDLDAGSARMFLILKILTRHYRVLFVYKVENHTRQYEEMLWREGVETARLPEYSNLLKARNFLAAIVSRPDLANDVLQSIRRYAPNVKIIFDMVDVHYLRLEQEYGISGDPAVQQQAKRYRKMELDLVQASDAVWYTSPSDMKAVTEYVSNIPASVIPTIHIQQSRGSSFEQRQNLLFIGNFSHRPNEDAVIFFVEEILPLIQKSLPDVKFDVVGSNASAELLCYSSEAVRFHGYVPDIGPLFQSSRVFVAPLRFGGGVKGKIGEALSYGLPVITTDVGAEGMGFEKGNQVLIANEPEEFAAAAVNAYTDHELWQQLSDSGYAHISKHFSPEALERTIFDSIVQEHQD